MDILINTLIFLLILILVLIILILASFKIYKKLPIKKRQKYISFLAKIALKLFRIELDIQGLENLPRDGGYLITPNHQSNFDVIFFQVFGVLSGFLAKIELKKIFFIRDLVKITESEFINRKSIRESVKVIDVASKKIKNGKVMVVFPEGTRSKTGKLLEFKLGAFRLATKVDAPIIPVTIIGAKDIKNRFPRKTKVTIIFDKPITKEEYQNLGSNDLALKIREIIENNLKRF